MYALDEISEDIGNFRLAVGQGRPYSPLYVKIKLVWGCNLLCLGCNHWREVRSEPLPLARWKEIVEDLAQLGCRKIHLSGGEPTLYPDLVALVEHITQAGIRCTMTTNGTLVSRDLARALGQAGLRGVNVSLDSPEPRIHDRMRGVKGAWKRAVKGARYLRRRLKKGKLRINTVISRLNYTSLTGMPDLAAGLGADFLNLIPLDENTRDVRRLNKQLILDYNQNIAPGLAAKAVAVGLMEQVEQAYPFGHDLAQVECDKQGLYAQGYYETHPCFAPWTHALIDQAGRVSICCMMRDEPIMGNACGESFRQVWEGRFYQSVRQRDRLPLFETCRKCDDFLKENRVILDLLQLKSENISTAESKRSNSAKLTRSD